ncbi:hypothetical protein CEUSTIGMA_g3741.t1 [Chlamydomonas eustigma]|uniref:Myb-like domain-containing protein n=1 Tax=Chlamydomonas eustigma TaxID=1157962 RepID=A0A250WZT7_9CHLO|nr:hypothetical protein CEUSTIGMA_g3741.t1 [Chlamydomonas eustigma]|eukprot:GAX76296.1 hypothetical protein CEUSTIGMA_g3741.t1 [Chlamydomonas eustigma]
MLRSPQETKWTKEDTARLTAAVQTVNERAKDPSKFCKFWVRVSELVPGRDAKQCRGKWLNDLRDGTRKDPFSLQEEFIIALIHSQVGNSWIKISSYLKGRTDNNVKNHWSAVARYKEGLSKNKTLREHNLLWQYVHLIVDHNMTPCAETLQLACEHYSSITSVVPLETFKVDEYYFITGPGRDMAGLDTGIEILQERLKRSTSALKRSPNQRPIKTSRLTSESAEDSPWVERSSSPEEGGSHCLDSNARNAPGTPPRHAKIDQEILPNTCREGLEDDRDESQIASISKAVGRRHALPPPNKFLGLQADSQLFHRSVHSSGLPLPSNLGYHADPRFYGHHLVAPVTTGSDGPSKALFRHSHKSAFSTSHLTSRDMAIAGMMRKGHNMQQCRAMCKAHEVKLQPHKHSSQSCAGAGEHGEGQDLRCDDPQVQASNNGCRMVTPLSGLNIMCMEGGLEADSPKQQQQLQMAKGVHNGLSNGLVKPIPSRLQQQQQQLVPGIFVRQRLIPSLAAAVHAQTGGSGPTTQNQWKQQEEQHKQEEEQHKQAHAEAPMVHVGDEPCSAVTTLLPSSSTATAAPLEPSRFGRDKSAVCRYQQATSDVTTSALTDKHQAPFLRSSAGCQVLPVDLKVVETLGKLAVDSKLTILERVEMMKKYVEVMQMTLHRRSQ